MLPSKRNFPEKNCYFHFVSFVTIKHVGEVTKTGPTRVRQMKQNKCFAESKKITKEGRKMEQKLDRWPP